MVTNEKSAGVATVLLSMLMTGLTGCQQASCPGDLLGQDQLRLLDTLDTVNKRYHLYARQTGFQEKVVYLELYDRSPVFDQCENPDVKPVYAVAYDDYPVKQHIRSVTLEPDEKKLLAIVYTQNTNEGFPDVFKVKFSR